MFVWRSEFKELKEKLEELERRVNSTRTEVFEDNIKTSGYLSYLYNNKATLKGKVDAILKHLGMEAVYKKECKEGVELQKPLTVSVVSDMELWAMNSQVNKKVSKKRKGRRKSK